MYRLTEAGFNSFGEDTFSDCIFYDAWDLSDNLKFRINHGETEYRDCMIKVRERDTGMCRGRYMIIRVYTDRRVIDGKRGEVLMTASELKYYATGKFDVFVPSGKQRCGCGGSGCSSCNDRGIVNKDPTYPGDIKGSLDSLDKEML